MAEGKPKFDAKLKEGVEYFEQMLKVMPDDRTTLEFLAVAYPQMGEDAKAEHALAELARVLLKEGDLDSAEALRPRLEECSSHEAKAMALRISAAKAPKPELVPESVSDETPVVSEENAFSAAIAAEAAFAEKLGEKDVAEYIRKLPDSGSLYLVSVLSVMEKERPENCEKLIAKLADEYGEVPVPLDAFEPDRGLVKKLGEELVRSRGVIPFARIGDITLVVTLSPSDAELKRKVSAAVGPKVRFYLAEPRMVEAAIKKIWPEEVPAS